MVLRAPKGGSRCSGCQGGFSGVAYAQRGSRCSGCQGRCSGVAYAGAQRGIKTGRVCKPGGGRSSREKGQCNAYAPEPNKDGLVFERLRVSRQLQAAPQLCQNAADSCAAACFAGSQAAPAAHTRC